MAAGQAGQAGQALQAPHAQHAPQVSQVLLAQHTSHAPHDLLDHLHPALWRAHQLGSQRDAVCSSGFAELDGELPGGGWPIRALTELLLPRPGIGEVRLLAPALAAVQRDGRDVLLFDPPALPLALTWAALGIDPQRLLLVRARAPRREPASAATPAGQGRAAGDRCTTATFAGTGTTTGTGSARRGPSHDAARARLPAAADLLWALEQALACGHAGAVLAWLPPRVRPESLRRLQLAAQAHEGPAWLLRESAAQLRPSAAPLRLLLAQAQADHIELQLLKRRGPPLARGLRLALPPALPAPARERALQALRTVAEPPLSSDLPNELSNEWSNTAPQRLPPPAGPATPKPASSNPARA